ncbi:MAG: hypothetical protein ABIL44_10500 [candidate division WOR-3 bacterium]
MEKYCNYQSPHRLTQHKRACPDENQGLCLTCLCVTHKQAALTQIFAAQKTSFMLEALFEIPNHVSGRAESI